MTNLLKYLKKSMGAILIIFALLVLQAYCDLSLPSYTSDIVNVGIQQSGINQVAPVAIRASEVDKLKLFLDDDTNKLFEESYEKKTVGDELKKDYPILETEEIYLLKEEAEVEKLNEDLAKPLVMVYMMESNEDSIKEKMIAQMPAVEGVDLSKMTIWQLFSQMDAKSFAELTAGLDKSMDSMQGSIMDQSAISYVKSEYEAIGIDLNHVQNSYLISTGGKMLLLALIAMIATIFVTLLASRVAAKTSQMLRRQVFEKVISFSNAEMDRFSTASLITRSTNDIQQIQMLIVMLLRMVFYAPILGLGGVFKVMTSNRSMAWIIALAVGLIIALVAVLLIVAMPKFNRMQSLVDRLNLVTREILVGLPVIRAFTTQKHEEERFDDANRTLTKNMLFTNRVMTFMMPVMMFIMNGIMVLIIWVGANGIDAGNLQVGDMMAFIQYTMQIVMSFLMLTMVSIILPRASVSAKRIDEVLRSENIILDPETTKSVDSTKGEVKFNNVCFRYPNAKEDVLSNLNFTAKPGETTAIIGSTGSGKSTLVNLIPRLYDVTQGSITIDGVDIRELSQHDLRGLIGFVPQKGVLFSGTIESNIGYGQHNQDLNEIKKAAEIAQATEFIESKEEKYDSAIAQGGTNVSGGQKQRLSIARAIAKNPKIYIFDDSFSALDYKTDVKLRKALKEETQDSTVIIVAQRISTILHAERIIVLDEGKIVGIGTHKELLKENEVYQQIALSQLSQKELDKDLEDTEKRAKENNDMQSEEVF